MGKRKSNIQNHDKPKRNRRNDQQNNNDSSDDEGPNDSLANLSTQFNGELNLSTRSGKIMTVKLRNFMCHSNLIVDFNPRANLLIGQNGSGKSAILTALIIGLGSKANATNRSSSIKDLIKTGESSATIEVHISNDGSDAYEFEKYGNRIIVVRQIAASGSSTYKLKSVSGSVISTSRSDLLKLILYMNIQVDNPVCVMTQDASRGFLRDSNPKKRYELFLKATQLDVIIEKLNGCLQIAQVSKAKFKDQQRKLRDAKEVQRKANEKLNQFKSMEPLKKETYRFKTERAWLSVIQQEEFIRAVNSELAETQAKKDECERQLAKYNVNDREMTEQNAQLNEEIRQLQQTQSDEQKKLDAEKKEYRRAIEQVSENERQVKKLEAKMAQVQKTISALEENIQSELSSNKNQIDEMKQANEAKLAAFNAKREDFESTLKNHRRELEIYSNTRAKCLQQLDTAKRNQLSLFNEKKHIQTQLGLMNASPKENLKQYGDMMVKLVETLDQYFKRGKFQKMPIGPIANHVEVKDSTYRQFVEDTLGGILMAFCVDNANDLATFREITKKLSFTAPVPVICSPFIDRQFDVSSKCVHSDNHTLRLMDLIVADSPVVMNCLIDQCSIETILFTKSFDYATHITSKKENVPSNLSKVILLEPYSEYFPAPAYRSYAKTSRPSRNLRVNKADREKVLQNDLLQINEKIEAAKSEIDQIQHKVNENGKLEDASRKVISKLDSSLSMLRLEISEIKSIEYPQDVDVEVMQSEVTEQSKILDSLTNAHESEQGKVDQLNATVQAIKGNLNEIRIRIQSIDTEIQEKQKSKDDISENLSKRDSMVAYYQKNKKALTEATIKYEKELEKLQEKLAKQEASALKTGPRIETTRSEEDLNKLIKRNETKLNAVSTSNETLESVTRKAEEADAEVERSDDLLSVFGQTLKMIIQSVSVRMQNVSKLKTFMITRTALYFTEIMNLRGIDGTLVFNNEAGTLDIQVIPRDKECDQVVSKTTNLSGGERSYTTVAFLISLWTCVDHPFFFLDEYDVFTDQVNRMFMTKLLLNEAAKKTLQYTFLTPQDTSEIEKSKDLDILRLENPDR